MTTVTAELVRLDDLTYRPFEMAVASWLASHSGLTRKRYAAEMRMWVRWCADHNLDPEAVIRPHVELYMRELEEERKLQRSSINTKLSAIASFYNYAQDENLISHNPVARVKRYRVSNESTRLGLDRMELGHFLAWAQSTSVMHHALACLLGLNALRVSEAITARIEDLDSVRGHHTLKILGKGHKIATIPLPPRCYRAVLQAVDERHEGTILLNTEGRPMTRWNATAAVKRIAKAAGITKKISPHSLRHSAITAALDAGVPMRDVQDLARHESPSTTTRYDRHRHNLDRHAAYLVQAYVAGG